MPKKNSSSGLVTLSRALRSPAEFASHLRIIDEATGRHIRMSEGLWEWQHDFLELLTQHKKLVLLKCRQVGVSWLLMVYALWKAHRFPGARCIVFSKGLRDAVHLMERLKFLCEYVPTEWAGHIQITSPNTQQIVGFANGSQIEAHPSTPEAGRGRPAALVIADEHAFHPYAKKNWASVEAAVERGNFVSVSTANGVGNFFHELYVGAEDEGNGFKKIFYPWGIHPERDDAWYEQKRQELPVWQLHQEYPAEDHEAFIQSGDPYFDDRCCKITAIMKEPLDWESSDWGTPLAAISGVMQKKLRFYQEPRENAPYAIGVDPSSGTSRTNDNTAICIIDANSGDQVFEWSMVAPYDEAAYLVNVLHGMYPGTVIVERNGIGAAMIRTLMSMGVTLWHDGLLVTLKGTQQTRPTFGYSTQVASKIFLLSLYEEACRQRWLKLASTELVSEMRTYERRENKTPQAGTGCRDDRIMAAGLAWLGRASVMTDHDTPTGGNIEPWSMQWWDNMADEASGFLQEPLGSQSLLWE